MKHLPIYLTHARISQHGPGLYAVIETKNYPRLSALSDAALDLVDRGFADYIVPMTNFTDISCSLYSCERKRDHVDQVKH